MNYTPNHTFTVKQRVNVIQQNIFKEKVKVYAFSE